MNDAEKRAQKNKRDIIITSILLVIFAISFTKNVLMRDSSGPPTVENSTAGYNMSDQLVSVTNIRLYDKLRQDRVALWDREWGRDPFEPQQALGGLVKAVNLTLNGILWDEKHPKAIVNEKTLAEGDTVHGYTVIQIKPRSVVLKTGEKNIELRVFRPVLGPPSELSVDGGPVAQ